MLEPTYIPESVHLDILFKDMQKKHSHFVVVVSEYGHTAGIITMEDILEELVGEIWDEQDEALETIIAEDENKYKVLASLSIDEFFEFFKLGESDEIEANTVNGWLTELLGNIPKVGDMLEYSNLDIEVISVDELMAHEIRVNVKEKAVSDDDDEE